MLGLYEFYWNCGRSGHLSGLFIEDEEVVRNLVGSKLYFGEVLGKHSEIYGTWDEGDVELISDDQEKIEWLQGLMKGKTISGFNPVEYVQDEGDEEWENE